MKTLNKIIAATLALVLASPAFAADRAEQNLPPEISHFPVTVAYRGQPIPVYARVTDKTGKIKSVSVFYALQQQAAPVEVKMKRLSDGRYSGAIPANFFFSSPTLWYFIEARDSFDDKAETSWTPVQIKDADTNPTQDSKTTPADSTGGNSPAGRTPGATANMPPAGSASPGPGTAAPGTVGTVGTAPATATPGTGTAAPAAGTAAPGTAAVAPAAGGGQPVIPGVAAAASPTAGTALPEGAVATSAGAGGGIGTTGIIIGGVLVGGGVAVAAGGGGGGGGSSGGGFDDSNVVSVNATGSASGGFSGGPQDKVINGAGVTAGKVITGVRVTLNYEAFGLPDKFQIIYRGNVIAQTGKVSGGGTIQGISGGSESTVIIRVLTEDASTAWNWNAKVEFSAQ